jgi:hypothetical protein
MPADKLLHDVTIAALLLGKDQVRCPDAVRINLSSAMNVKYLSFRSNLSQSNEDFLIKILSFA